MLNLYNGLAFIAVLIAVSGLVWAACAWWYGQRVDEFRQKLQKVRQVAALQLQQARRQVQALQQELQASQGAAEGMRKSLELAQTEQRAQAASVAASQTVAAARGHQGARTPRRVDAGTPSGLMSLPANGFADTMPFTG